MGNYTCQECARGLEYAPPHNQDIGRKNSDNDGYHHAVKADGSVFEFCHACLGAVVAAHENDYVSLVSIDGKSLDDHFVCPYCLAVCPDSEQREYQTGEGWVQFCCPACRVHKPGPA